jgi:hypothetical protein
MQPDSSRMTPGNERAPKSAGFEAQYRMDVLLFSRGHTTEPTGDECGVLPSESATWFAPMPSDSHSSASAGDWRTCGIVEVPEPQARGLACTRETSRRTAVSSMYGLRKAFPLVRDGLRSPRPHDEVRRGNADDRTSWNRTNFGRSCEMRYCLCDLSQVPDVQAAACR